MQPSRLGIRAESGSTAVVTSGGDISSEEISSSPGGSQRPSSSRRCCCRRRRTHNYYYWQRRWTKWGRRLVRVIPPLGKSGLGFKEHGEALGAWDRRFKSGRPHLIGQCAINST